jgi:hypothetical protein
MATAKRFPITELDFDQIKSSLKTYLKGQDRFKDYDYEGSNLNVLLDVLSYNTYQNNFYNNMAISEMFLDSAQLRDSIVSHAKELNYLPRSKTSARAVVDVGFNVFGNPSFITIPEKTEFIAKCGNETYKFYNERSATVFPSENGYVIRSLDIYEGQYLTEIFEVEDRPSQRYVISNRDIDLNSIRVRVRTGDDVEEFLYAADLFGLKTDSKVFFIQPHIGDRYELFFGRDVFGVEPETNSIIEVEYRITSGAKGNGITSYTIEGTIAGFQPAVVLRSPSRGGADREDLKSIKYFAPKAIQIQDRAITESDFEILLKRRFPEIRNVSVFGGENTVPPQYGRVIVSIDLQGFDGITLDNRERYRIYLKERASLSIEPVIIPANYMYYEVDTTVNFNVKDTNKSAADIREIVRQTVLGFSNTNLSGFRKSLRTTKMTAAIDSSDESIVSNLTQVRGIIEISPGLGFEENFTLRFNNRLLAHPPRSNPSLAEGRINIPVAIISSTFVYDGFNAFIRDNGRGTLQIITRDENRVDVLLGNAGSVNYQTGDVNITGFRVDGYSGPAIKIYATAVDRDFNAPVDRITSIREEDLKITIIGIRE